MKATVNILRFNPEKDQFPLVQSYEYDLQSGMTVLDVLNYVHDNIDSSLTYSYCCRNGHCGLCAANIDKKPTLSCKAQAYDNMTIEPLDNLRILRDLLVDREDYERLRPQLRLFLERQCDHVDGPETIDMESFERFKTASRCIECYSCVSACPVYKRSPHSFIGPAALTLEARPFFDCRDELNRNVLIKSSGIDRCIECGLCSKVCAVNADPCGMIRLMKKLMN